MQQQVVCTCVMHMQIVCVHARVCICVCAVQCGAVHVCACVLCVCAYVYLCMLMCTNFVPYLPGKVSSVYSGQQGDHDVVLSAYTVWSCTYIHTHAHTKQSCPRIMQSTRKDAHHCNMHLMQGVADS